MVASCRDSTLVIISIILIIALVLCGTCNIAVAQGNTTFTPEDSFDIPGFNGSIAFAVNGTYAEASLVNGTWHFVNLQLAYSHVLEQLEVSAQNSHITIISYWQFNATSGTTLLSYRVEGQGTQTFNLGLDLEKGEFSVVFDEIFMGEGDGWTLSPDGTLTITGATSNVTIWYFGFPDSFRVNGDPNQPFYQQHSVAITIAIALVITVTLTLAIKRRNKKHLETT